MRDPRERLRDALEAIEQIERRVGGDRREFDGNELLQVWVLHHLQRVGEACRALPAELRRRNANVGWKRIIGMRHVLVHQYFEIDKDVVWAVVERELAPLKNALQGILSALPPDDGA